MANSKGIKSLKGTSPGLMGAAGWGVIDGMMNMAAGDDFGTAALKATASTALWYTAPGVMTAYSVGTAIPAVAGAAYQWGRSQRAWWSNSHLNGQVGGNYQDNQRALTMRQAAVNTIQSSKLNARSALGGEARILNQNWNRQ